MKRLSNQNWFYEIEKPGVLPGFSFANFFRNYLAGNFY